MSDFKSLHTHTGVFFKFYSWVELFWEFLYVRSPNLTCIVGVCIVAAVRV